MPDENILSENMICENKKTSKKKTGKNMLKSLMLIAFLILFSSLNFAADQQNMLSAWPSWVTWAAILVGIACLIVAITFIVSRIFVIPALEAWVKEEFGEILFTVFLIIIFSAFAGTLEVASSDLAKNILQSKVTAEGSVNFWTYNSGTGRWSTQSTASPSCSYPCHVYIARGFLGSLYESYGDYIKGLAKELAVSTLLESLNIGGATSIKIFVVIIDISASLPIYASRAIYNNTLNTLLSEIMKITATIKFQEIALVYISKLSPILFISGLLLRIPFFTRKLGGLLVALGLGLYVIFPLTYVLAWYTVDKSTVVLGETQMTMPDPADWGKLGETGTPNGVDLMFTKYDAAGKETQVGLIEVLGRAFAFSMLLPLFSIFLTIGFVRHFSPMIGGDPEIAGLTRLI